MSEAPPSYEPHEVHVEAPDFVCYRLRGELTLPHVPPLVAAERPTWAGHARVYVLVDMREMKSFSAGLMRAMPEAYRGAPVRVVAVFGASFALKVMANAIQRGLAALGQEMLLRFFSDEASARAWLAAKRENPDRKSRPGGSRPGRSEP